MLLFAVLFFFFGLFGIIFRQKNFLSLLICLEVLILGAIMIFIFIGVTYYEGYGFIYALLLMVISTVETAIGLSLLLMIYKKKGNLIISNFQRFRY
jgi:NADH-quinone oxidoreductase subunit K